MQVVDACHGRAAGGRGAVRDRVLQDGVGTDHGADADDDHGVARRVVVRARRRRRGPDPARRPRRAAPRPADHEARRRDGVGDEGRQDAELAGSRPAARRERLVRETWATSMSWCVFSARITPDWRSTSSSIGRRGMRRSDRVPGGTAFRAARPVTTITA